MTRKPVRVLIALVLVAGAVGGAIGVASASSTLQLDENTPLTKQSNIEQYDSGEPVTVHPQQVMMSITVAHKPSAVGLDTIDLSRAQINVDSANSYIRIQYNESMGRTVRFYVPKGYWTPYPRETVESIGENDATATYEVTNGGNMTAVTVTFDGKADVVFPVSLEASATWAAHSWSREFIENQTNYSIPSFAADRQWERLNTSAITGANTTAKIQHGEQSLIVQYDAQEGPGHTWTNARSCADASTPVCTFTRDSVPGVTFVRGVDSPPPPTRYKIGGGPLDRIRGAFREIRFDFLNPKQVLQDLLPWS